MKKRKLAVLLMAACLFTVSLFLGCDINSAKAEKTKVTIALWSGQLMENYIPWLEEQFPNVEFDVCSATNSTDYYNYLASCDELPDIMTVRRFSLKDVEGIKEQLIDLSDTELANNYYQSYLNSYTYTDGVVNWLPACAEIDTIIANKTLFEENNIPLPTDWDSFVYACEEFEKLGITGYTTDMFADYTCLETLQGFSVGVLSSTEGRQWRQDYESGVTNQLSEDVWLPAFEKLEEVIKVTGMNEDTLELRSGDIGEAFSEGKIAMFRGTVTNMELYGNQYEKIMLPYPGDSDEESAYLTYPVFQVAAKKTDSEEREQLILDIMTTMLSEDGLNNIIPGESMVAYNKNVQMNLKDNISNLEPYINENRIYIRLASSEMFSTSLTVVNKMLTGEISDAKSAFDEFNKILAENKPEEAETVAHIDTTYSRTFTSEHGNQAASALFNTIREEMGVDCIIAQSASVGCDIQEGDYTQAELGYLLNWESSDVRQMELTGSELKEYVEWYLTVKKTRESVVNEYTLPVTSGFEITVSQKGGEYHLEKLTINGEKVDDEKTYTVVSWDGFDCNYTDLLETAGFNEFEKLDVDLETYITKRLAEDGGQLSEPNDYIALK